MKIAVLLSGRGSNMLALHRALQEQKAESCAKDASAEDASAEIIQVISNRPNSAGIEKARELSLPCEIIDHERFESREEHERALHKALCRSGADLICLAGYMRILSADFVRKWRGKIINIHPSLLPSFPGTDTHKRALEAGVLFHGCSVHFVTAELDGGPVIAKEPVRIHRGDTPDCLAKRVLEKEHTLYPHALNLVASGLAVFRNETEIEYRFKDESQFSTA